MMAMAYDRVEPKGHLVIARSESDETIQAAFGPWFWIASVRSQ
jgi:hypothetical protein